MNVELLPVAYYNNRLLGFPFYGCPFHGLNLMPFNLNIVHFAHSYRLG